MGIYSEENLPKEKRKSGAKKKKEKVAGVNYRHPGPGAVEFASTYTIGLTRKAAHSVVVSLLKDEMPDQDDKRVKRCDYCGYPYRDTTRPNNSKTCSKECKTDRDTLKRRQKQADKRLLQPRKKTKREQYYVSWLEYPFWINEYEMLKQSWKRENPYENDKVERIKGARQRTDKLNGKRKPRITTPYSGEDGEKQQKVRVKFAADRKAREPGEVITYKLSEEEVRSYYEGKYSERERYLIRLRALEQKKFSRSKKGIRG